MSDQKKTEIEDQHPQTSQSQNKKSIRFVEELGVNEDQMPSGNSMKSVNTSRAVSDSTHEDEEDLIDMISDNNFSQIKNIDVILHSREDKLSETTSPTKKGEKIGTTSSVQSENQDENLSVHFGGLEIVDENDLPKFEYEPDDIPMKSILKNDLNRSRNISFDVRQKDCFYFLLQQNKVSNNIKYTKY